ncbi:deoxyuridine 5'-triphosphate nucleotidohydrolase [Kwoniella newhampshirensis]|uniref:Deoxyuridine 5'-triphosphate nucleotidohydrolase n=1 Tax=Kwoniella newhampshirensis TaxID=1651941 RepID=A0AAW0Z519_9TREE
MDVQLLSDRATLPTLGSDFAAGMDLYSAETKTVPARGKGSGRLAAVDRGAKGTLWADRSAKWTSSQARNSDRSRGHRRRLPRSGHGPAFQPL